LNFKNVFFNCFVKIPKKVNIDFQIKSGNKKSIFLFWPQRMQGIQTDLHDYKNTPLLSGHNLCLCLTVRWSNMAFESASCITHVSIVVYIKMPSSWVSCQSNDHFPPDTVLLMKKMSRNVTMHISTYKSYIEGNKKFSTLTSPVLKRKKSKRKKSTDNN